VLLSPAEAAQVSRSASRDQRPRWRAERPGNVRAALSLAEMQSRGDLDDDDCRHDEVDGHAERRPPIACQLRTGSGAAKVLQSVSR
jgi:hypothetical protein